MAEAGTSRQKIPAWRYKFGLGMFVVGNLVVPLSPVFTAMGLPASYIPVVIVAGEVMIFSAIPFLGKQGFLQLKNKMKALFQTPAGRGAQARQSLAPRPGVDPRIRNSLSDAGHSYVFWLFVLCRGHAGATLSRSLGNGF